MRKLVYYVGVSLDGYIAGPHGEIDFYPLSDQMAAWINTRYPETLPTHIRKLVGLDGVPNQVFDTLVMGRGTYEPALDVPTTSPYAHLRQYVVSRTLTIDDPTVTVETDNPIALVRRLKAGATGMDIWLCWRASSGLLSSPPPGANPLTTAHRSPGSPGRKNAGRIGRRQNTPPSFVHRRSQLVASESWTAGVRS